MNINDIYFDEVQVKDVIEFNTRIKTWIDEESEHFVRNKSLLESSVKGVYIGYYKNNLDRFSEMWYRLAKNHPFSNGNKRTALYTIKWTIIVGVLVHFKKEFHSIKNKKEKHFFLKGMLSSFLGSWKDEYNISLEIAASSKEKKEIIIEKVKKNIEKTFNLVFSYAEEKLIENVSKT